MDKGMATTTRVIPVRGVSSFGFLNGISPLPPRRNRNNYRGLSLSVALALSVSSMGSPPPNQGQYMERPIDLHGYLR